MAKRGRKAQSIKTDKALENFKNSKSGKKLYDKALQQQQLLLGPAFDEAEFDKHIVDELKTRYSSKTKASEEIKWYLSQANKSLDEKLLGRAKLEAKATATFDLRSLNRKKFDIVDGNSTNIDPTDLLQTANASDVMLLDYYKFDGTDIILLHLSVAYHGGSPIDSWIYASAGLLAKYGI